MTRAELQAMIEEMILNQMKVVGTTVTDAVKEAVQAEVKGLFSKEIVKPNPTEGDPKGGFKCFAEFAQAVFKAGPGGQNAEQRLLDLNKKAAGTPAMSEGTSDAGGYLVPEEFRASLLEIAIEKSSILTRAMLIPMNTLSIGIPYVNDASHAGGTTHGGIEFKWLDEAAEKGASKPKLGKVTLTLRKCAGLCYTSDEILQDSPITVEPMLNRMFTDALAWQLDWVFLNGSGVGQPLGVLNAPCLVQVAHEDGQAGGTVKYENVLKMYARMWNKTNMIWMANDEVLPQLGTMSLAVGTGGAPVYIPAGGASGKPYDTLFGKPLVFTEHCRAAGHLGDILACDWTQYLVGQKAGPMGGLQFASSIHLKFDFDQTAFRFVFRVDGQPWWPQALTPRYGTATKSPFVGLADRGLAS